MTDRSKEDNMKKSGKLMLTAVSLATLFGTSAIAQTRHFVPTERTTYTVADRYRENERVTTEGRITNVTRDRGGYRVELDRGGYSYWVPDDTIRARANDF